jgi:uncharacterized membrane protein
MKYLLELVESLNQLKNPHLISESGLKEDYKTLKKIRKILKDNVSFHL